MSTYNISHSVVIVNRIAETKPQLHKQPDKFSAFADRKKKSVIIAEMLAAVGEKKRSLLMKGCNSNIQLQKCNVCGKVHITNANLCRDRLCPNCGYLLSVKRYNDMCKAMDLIPNKDNYDWRFVTLTVRNCAPHRLAPTLAEMLKAWDKVCKRRNIKREMKGFGRSIEITYNTETGTFHPHIHILTMFSKNCAPDILEVKSLWRQSMQLDYEPICDIRAPYCTSAYSDSLLSSVVECFKYAIKFKSVPDMPLDSFKYLVGAVKNRKLVSFGGEIAKARALAGIVENDTIQDEVSGSPECCGQSMAEVLLEWSFPQNMYTVIKENAINGKNN